jgi:hypothetical protein
VRDDTHHLVDDVAGRLVGPNGADDITVLFARYAMRSPHACGRVGTTPTSNREFVVAVSAFSLPPKRLHLVARGSRSAVR